MCVLQDGHVESLSLVVASVVGRNCLGNGRWNDLLETLTDQTRPVVDSSAHEAAVDVVEFAMISGL